MAKRSKYSTALFEVITNSRKPEKPLGKAPGVAALATPRWWFRSRSLYPLPGPESAAPPEPLSSDPNDPTANVTAAVMTSMWRLTDFAGRADLVVTEGTATGLSASECWGPDTLLLYRHRDWEPLADIGTAQACSIAPAVTRPQL